MIKEYLEDLIDLKRLNLFFLAINLKRNKYFTRKIFP